jgi:sugar lactone lactonase YvrE
MAIESAARFRRLARTWLSVFLGMLSLCVAASAQKQLVSTGSVIPLQHSTSYNQIYTIDIAPNGDVLFLDTAAGSGSIYQLKNGTDTIQTLTTSISPAGDTYWNQGMAMDAKGNLYLTARYGSPFMYRVPYNNGNYQYSSSTDNWESTLDGGFEGNGTQNAFFLNNPAMDGSGLLFVSEQSPNLLVIPVNADGTVPLFPSGPNAGQPEFQYIIKGLKDKIQPLIADVNGNIYFIENPYEAPALRTTGIFFVPASAYKSCLAASIAGTGTPTVPCISGTESSLSRVDPGNTEPYDGITLDAAGNIYVGEQNNSAYGATTAGLVMIPNESGSPVGVSATSFNFSDAEYLSPAPVNANPTIDPRGFIWLPTGGASNWSPNGSGPIPGTGNLVLWALGTSNLGATPVGTPSATGTVFYSFSGSVTPASIAFSQPGGGTDFSTVATNPYPPTAGTTPTVPCTANTAAMPNTYVANSYCESWVALTPQGPNSVGTVAGQLSMLDATNKVISGSTANLTGIGVGPAAALLVPANQTPLATGLVSPQQVAGDSLGNSYVADSGLGKVLEFAAGSTTASAGTPIGTGLKAPTGVAVDGNGDVYIADSGKVIEVPAVSGTLNPAGQVVLESGLGTNLSLAVDGAGNVYAADPANARVDKIYNPQMSMVIEPTISGSTTIPNTVGTGFTKPTAVAVDDSGDVFVADGANLDEINFWGGQTTITSSLSAPVTGLAVDPSGSVYVAQSGGILRIPFETTSTTAGLSFNDAAAIDSGGVTAPSGLGMDSLGNFYVTAASYNVSTISSTGAGTSSVTTPNVLLLNGALVNFGLVSQQTQDGPIDVNVYNIGNAPLAVTAPPTFAGTNAADYGYQPDGLNPCDTSGATTIASATACQLGVVVTAQGLAVSQGSMAVTTTAVNAPTTSAVLEAYSSDLLCRTLTTITLNPATGLTYPATTTVTSTTVPDPAHPCAAGGVPQGGKITLTLAPQAKGASQSTQTKTLPVSGQATFNLTSLSGGTFAIYASYLGDPVYGGSASAKTFTVVVARAASTITLSEPAGVTPTNSTYYVLQGSATTLQASVTSSLGSPTGSVQFLNGSTPADKTQNPVTLSGGGTATFTTTNLAAGTYNLTAVYSGDGNFAPVTSSVVTIVVVPPITLITANPTSVSTKAGTPVSSTLTITALEGYSPNLGVQLYCDNTTLPQYAECTFDVPTVDIVDHAGIPQISHVTISSNLPVNVGELRAGRSPIAFAGLFGLGLFGLALRRRGKFNRSALTLLCLLLSFGGAVGGLTGCTNSGYTQTPPAPHVTTPSGTYNVSIYTLDLNTGKVSSLPFTLGVTIQ